MKKIIIVLILIYNYSAFAQKEDDKVVYKAISIEMVITDGDKNTNIKPMGNNVEVIYDKFFKSFNIFYYDETGTYGTFDLFYIKDNPDKSISMNLRDNSKTLVFDELSAKGMLTIFMENTYDGRIGYLVIKGAIIKK